MTEDASSHTVIVQCIQFEVSPNANGLLLGMPPTLEPSTIKTTSTEQVHDVGTSTLSTDPVDSHAMGDHSNGGDASEDVLHDEDFFILIEKYCTMLNTKNSLTQKDFLHFFRHVATNLDHVAPKATFSQTHMQFMIRLARAEPINLSS